jgi:hypothetical protein
MWIGGAMVSLLGFALLQGKGQTPPRSVSGALILVSSSTPGEKALEARSSVAQPLPAYAGPTQEIIREIDDPSSGQRWLLVRDDAHAGGPGLLLLAGGGRDLNRAGPVAGGAQVPVQIPGQIPVQIPVQGAADPPVIRSGDRVQVEEHSATVDARLEAVALTPAWPGTAFHARLAIGGKVVRAVAVGPGRAAFQNQRAALPAQKEAPQ